MEAPCFARVNDCGVFRDSNDDLGTQDLERRLDWPTRTGARKLRWLVWLSSRSLEVERVLEF